MKKPRPICVHCGDAYGQRDTHSESVTFVPGNPKPVYRGNGVVVRERERPSKSDWSQDAGNHNIKEMIVSRDVWDGLTWHGGYTPFCTLRCALDYARKAYKKEKRT